MNSTSFLKTLLLSVSPQNSVNGRHETSALYPVKCAECVSFDTVIVLKEKKISLKKSLSPPMVPPPPPPSSWKEILNPPPLIMIIIRCFRNAEILTPFSHCTKTDKMCKKERKEKPRNTLYSIVRFYMLYVQKKKDVLLHLLLLLMQWKKEKENTTTYTATVWLHILQKRYYYNYYATKKTSPSPTKNTTMKMKKNVLLLLYIPQSINQGHIPSITSLYTLFTR